jgi:CBS domain containing-hemolysin-like protein
MGFSLGVTIVSLTLGWVGEPIVAHLVENIGFINKVPHAAVYAHGIAIVLSFSADYLPARHSRRTRT